VPKPRDGPPGFCSKWYYSPLGNAEITTFPDVSKLMPQVAVITPKMEFVRDDDFAKVVGLSNFDRVALTFSGILEVLNAGEYTVCVTSDDGSHVLIDGQEIAAAPGLHPPVTGCGKRTLSAGDHEVTGRFFENGGGAYYRVTYYGPDTNNAEVVMPSAGFEGNCSVPEATCPCGAGWCSKWFYNPLGTGAILRFPDVDKLNPQAVMTLSSMDVPDDGAFGRLLGRGGGFTNVAAQFSGVLSIKQSGTYRLCSISDDGSHVFLDGEDLVDNGGLHGMAKKCGDAQLDEGDHKVRVTFFQNGGGAGLQVVYSGPDTDGKEVLMPSAWHSDDKCGRNPNAPPEVCECAGGKEMAPPGECSAFRSLGYQKCKQKPGCRGSISCG
jgi:hypothetical protein